MDDRRWTATIVHRLSSIVHRPTRREPNMATLRTQNHRNHVSMTASARSMLTGRFSRHPERYVEIVRIIRKYQLHHVVAQLGMTHRHEEEDGLHAPAAHEEDDHS